LTGQLATEWAKLFPELVSSVI